MPAYTDPPSANNTPPWEHIKTVDVSGTSSTSMSFTDTWQTIKIYFTGGNGEGFDEITINNVTANQIYNIVDNSDTAHNGQTEIATGYSAAPPRTNEFSSIVFHLDRANSNTVVIFNGGSDELQQSETAEIAESPVNSIQLTDSSATDKNAKAEVFGLK